MNASTPIRGMDHIEACRALGPALVRMREADAQLPKTVEAAARVDNTTIARLARDAVVTHHNVVLIARQICETGTDPSLVRLAMDA